MFKNEALTDFSQPHNKSALLSALKDAEERLRLGPFEVHPLIDGQIIDSSQKFRRCDPSNPARVVAVSHFALPQHLPSALKSLRAGASAWAATSVETRISVAEKLAELMRAKRWELMAAIIREVGKPWREADADVAEAIDFCEYYAQQMKHLGTPRQTAQVANEENWYFYQPRGIAAVIAPWNFPLAITCGMTVAALIAGNSVALKPAEQASLVGYLLAQLLFEAGLPKDVLAFLPGRGESVGNLLVEEPNIDLICFTGSKQVGLEIVAKAAQTKPGQRGIKRVIAELGGKNAIIVDQTAPLENTVKGVIASAFGFSGQKCSACSRLIVVGDLYEPFLERLCLAADQIEPGPADDPATFMGPLVDTESAKRVLKTINQAKKGCRLALCGQGPAAECYVPLHIFRDVPPDHPLWRDEIFGPVLACRQAQDFGQALAFANDSPYALTGGLYSSDDQHIALAKRDFAVGNLYINRHCTGAMVCRQPFGGGRMSGIGSKAGGPDYLLQFMEPRVVTQALGA